MTRRPEADQAGPAQARLEDAAVTLDPAARAARGKAARKTVPRQAHAQFEPPPGRPDPVGLLERQAASRVPELLPIRYGRMLASPLGYFRGAALAMAADLHTTPATGFIVQASGDAHLSNFGIFASPERRLVFDINDFDETLPAPWEWDVKRLVASLEVAGRVSGFGTKQRRGAVLAAAGHYRTEMRRLAGLRNLELWYSRGELDELAGKYQVVLSRPERKLAGTDLARAEAEVRGRPAVTRQATGRPRITASPPLVVPLGDLGSRQDNDIAGHLRRVVAGYRQSLEPDRRYLISQYAIADLARMVAGVGSVGLRCWAVLLTGRDFDDQLFLQVKEAQPSVLAEFAGASPYSNQGRRVVSGQRLMQAVSDEFLGWHRAPAAAGPADYYVRQLRDWKYSIATAQLAPRTLASYGALCGRTLARAHARSGDRIAIAAYLGTSAAFDTALAVFASAYADQNERDYAQFRAAVTAGRLPAGEHKVSLP